MRRSGPIRGSASSNSGLSAGVEWRRPRAIAHRRCGRTDLDLHHSPGSPDPSAWAPVTAKHPSPRATGSFRPPLPIENRTADQRATGCTRCITERFMVDEFATSVAKKSAGGAGPGIRDIGRRRRPPAMAHNNLEYSITTYQIAVLRAPAPSVRRPIRFRFGRTKPALAVYLRMTRDSTSCRSCTALNWIANPPGK
jgi:hypothetical protein